MCDDLAGLGWLPKRFGVQPSAVHQWRRRGLLPPPLAADGLAVPVWRKRDLEAWGHQTGRLVKVTAHTRHRDARTLAGIREQPSAEFYPAAYPFAEIIDDLWSEADEQEKDLVKIEVARMRRDGPGGSREDTDAVTGDRLTELIHGCRGGHDTEDVTRDTA